MNKENIMLNKLKNNRPWLAAMILAGIGLSGLEVEALANDVTQLFDFEDGAQGWTVAGDSSTSCNASSISPNWTLNTSMDGWSPESTWWTNTNYGQLGAERSYVTSPVLTAMDTNVSINFDSWSNNEGGYPTYYDVEHVQISINGGAFTDVHGSTEQLHNYGDSTIRNITFTTIDIMPDDQIQYRFLYDTCDSCCGTSGPGRGWAFDNVLVTGATQDSDGDGVYDYADTCLGTDPNAVIIYEDGCSAEQLADLDCPCGTLDPTTHDDYERCISSAAREYFYGNQRDIRQAKRDYIKSRSATDCGLDAL